MNTATIQRGAPALLTSMRATTFIPRIVGFLFWVATGRPSVLWRFVAAAVGYLGVRLRILPGQAKHVAQVRGEFEAQAAHGEFRESWFDLADLSLIHWCGTFSRIFDRDEPVRILEIGSWEGRSTLFLLTYFTRGRLTAVDSWEGSDEQYEFNADATDLEIRFDTNMALCADRLTKRSGSSLDVLPQLLSEQQQFDVIYVDGSHFADDVLTDGITAWRLLRPGGVLIFDDLLWCLYERWRDNPAWAIKLFLKYHAGRYKILGVYTQIIVQKLS